MKVMVIVGTRPEVIKMVPVIKALRDAAVERIVCASGQHREMLAQALDVFAIKPDISLDVMAPGQTLNGLSARLLEALDQSLSDVQPDWVLVQGDTTTALCGGLAAFYRGIRVAHVEAGLRTGNLASPFPEEANRRLLAQIATLHFAPTRAARTALLGEGIPPGAVCLTGNTVVDAIGMALDIISQTEKSEILMRVLAEAGDKPLVLVTCHRRESLGGPLEEICHLLKRLAVRYENFHWVFPVHLNPCVQEPVHRILTGIANLSLIGPVDYLTNLNFIARAALVVSDSGGIQEEAPSFGVPVVVMRNHTERREGIDAGFAGLAGQSAENIEAAVVSWIENPERRKRLKRQPNPYGDGNAARRIVAAIRGEAVVEFDA